MACKRESIGDGWYECHDCAVMWRFDRCWKNDKPVYRPGWRTILAGAGAWLALILFVLLIWKGGNQ